MKAFPVQVRIFIEHSPCPLFKKNIYLHKQPQLYFEEVASSLSIPPSLSKGKESKLLNTQINFIMHQTKGNY